MNEIIAILPYAAPLAYASLGEVIGERGGVINIGLEGSLLFAAYGALVGTSWGHSIWVGLLVAVLTGLIANLVGGWFTIVLGSDMVVVGTAMNLLALGVTGALFRKAYGHSGQLLSLPTLARWHGFDVCLALLLLLVPCIWWLIYRTGWGLALRAMGEYARAAEAAGFHVKRVRMQATALAGLLAGLGGGYLVLGTTGSFTENMTSGRGFVAIALVTFGRMHPLLVFAAALMMGYLQGLQFQLQASGSRIPSEFLLALPYAVALLVLVLVGKGGWAPWRVKRVS